MVMDIRSLVPAQTKAELGKTEKSKKKSTASDSGNGSDESDDDSINLTTQSSQISKLIQQMKSAPVLDPDRVSPVKDKLDKGEYDIEYQQVANKMLDFETSYQGY